MLITEVEGGKIDQSYLKKIQYCMIYIIYIVVIYV